MPSIKSDFVFSERERLRTPLPCDRGCVIFTPWFPGHPCVCSFAPLIIATFCWGHLCSFLGQETL